MKMGSLIHIIASVIALVILTLYLMNIITGEQTAFAYTVALPYIWHLLKERRKRNLHSKKLNLKIPEDDENERI